MRGLKAVALLGLLIASASAHALGLGQIEVTSALNQRFTAVIPFTSLTADEAPNVRARLADNSEFERVGLERSAYLSTLRVDVVTDGTPRVVLSSSEIAREPLITLLIEVRTLGGPRILREFTVFLDPPSATAAARPQPLAAPPPAPAAAPAPRAAAPASGAEFYRAPDDEAPVRVVTQASRPAASAAPASKAVPKPEPKPAVETETAPARPRNADGTWGPVRSGDTLNTAANGLRPSGASLAQARQALFAANPEAFANGDINALRRGVLLTVPEDAVMRGQAPAAPVVAPAPPTAAPAAAAAAPATAAAPAAPAADETIKEVVPEPAAAQQTPVAPAPEAPVPDGEIRLAEPAQAEAESAAAEPATVRPDSLLSNLDTLLPGSGALLEHPLFLAFAALVALLFVLVLVRLVRDQKAQRDYRKAASRVPKRPAPRRSLAKPAAATAAAAAAGMTVAEGGREELEALERRFAAEPERAAPAEAEMPLAAPPAFAPFQPAPVEMPSPAEVDALLQAPPGLLADERRPRASDAGAVLEFGLYDEPRSAPPLAPTLPDFDAGLDPLPEPRATPRTAPDADPAFLLDFPAEPFTRAPDSPQPEPYAEPYAEAYAEPALIPGPRGGAVPASASPRREPVLELPRTDDLMLTPVARQDQEFEFSFEEFESTSGSDPAQAQADELLDRDLGSFDLGGGSRPAPPRAPQLPDFELLAPQSQRAAPQVTLDSFEPLALDDAEPQELLDGGDDAGTKLDLARAYAEMGDAEMARSLLDEVDAEGSAAQKAESAALRARLAG